MKLEARPFLASLPEESRLAVRNLMRHKLRTALTTLGIVFGVAAVLCMFGVGTGAREQIYREIGSLGITNIYLNSVRQVQSSRNTEEKSSGVHRFGLTFQDLDQMRASLPEVEEVVPVHDVLHKIYHRARPINARARGVSPAYLAILDLKPSRGRSLSDLDELEGARVAVVPRKLLDDVGHLGDPLDAVFNVGRECFRVVGVYEPEAFASHESKVREEDSRIPTIYVPLASSYRYFGTRAVQQSSGSFENIEEEVSQAVIKVSSSDMVTMVARQLERILKHYHKSQDYEIIVPLSLLRQRERTQAIFNIVMLLIASISLLVGGIGIVNIMLATITERTREIGIRRALGARRVDIRRQFLIETVVISLAGGIAGCLLGVGGVLAIERFTGWLAILEPGDFALSLGISCGAGILFGLYPANRAARMEPVEALRHA